MVCEEGSISLPHQWPPRPNKEITCERYLKKNGARLGPKEVAGKFDGYSEAWLKVNFEMKSLVMLMNQIKDSEA